MASYTIQSGDTLSGIASRYGLTIDAIMAANAGNSAIKTRDLIYAGKSITIPSGGQTADTGKYVKTADNANVYDISTGTPRYVSYTEAQQKNIWNKIQVVNSIPGITPAQQTAPTSNQNNNPTPTPTPTPTQQPQQSSTSWQLSRWQSTGNGSWSQQPTLTINGQSYVFATPAEYIAKLQELRSIPGMTGPIDQYISEFQSAVPEFTRASNPTPATVTNPVSVNTGNASLPSIEVPQELADNPYFKQLDQDNQTLVAYYWNITNTQNTQKQQAFKDALNLASQQADPYWREKINLVKDETERTFATLSADTASKEAELSRRSQAIADDLKYNKEYLSTEQQAELSRQKDDYDKQLGVIRENMATRGLTSSSVNTQAQESLASMNEDVIGSVQRKYAKEQRDLGVGSERDVADITAQLTDLRRRLGESKTDVARKAETYLGSTEANNIPGMSSYLMGNISGTMVEDKGADILARANGLLSQSI